jgi:hypothetical protein
MYWRIDSPLKNATTILEYPLHFAVLAHCCTRNYNFDEKETKIKNNLDCHQKPRWDLLMKKTEANIS